MLPIALSIVIGFSAPGTAPGSGPADPRVEMDTAVEFLSADKPAEALEALRRADQALDRAPASAMTERLRRTIAINQGIAAIELHRARNVTEPLEQAHARLHGIDRSAIADDAVRTQLDEVRAAVRRELSQSTATEASAHEAPKKLPKTTVAGVAVLSSAAVGLGFMVTGLVQGSLAERDFERGPTRNDRVQADQSGAKANTMAFVGGLAAGILLGVGTALVVLGQRVDQRGHETARRSRIRVAPLQVRF